MEPSTGSPSYRKTTNSASASDADSTAAVVRCQSSVRWWLAVVLGSAVSFPAGWLLSYAAMLPGLLGLFFFVLIGLLIGAVTFRVARAGRPYRRLAVVAGTTVVVGVAWATSILQETHEFPQDVARAVAGGTRDLQGVSVAQFREQTADSVRAFLRESYSPGGALGYMRWVLTSGEIRSGQIPGIKRHFRRKQHTFWWGVRVTLAIACLGFGIGSQTLSLQRASDERPAAADPSDASPSKPSPVS